MRIGHLGKYALLGLAVSLLAFGALACESDADVEEEEETGAGVVTLPPEGATPVYVTLSEWNVNIRPSAIPAGQVYFLVQNIGPVDPHELVVIRSDAALDGLPRVEGKVPEDQVDFISEVEEFAPGTAASGVMNLTPGRYLLICNITEIEEGELESHYEEGMRTELIVN